MEIRKRLRRELITRTAQIWSKINKNLVKDLRKLSINWLQEITPLQEQKIPKEFTEILQKALREAMAYGYWLQYLYLFELRGNKYRGKITLSEAEDVKQQLQDFIAGSEWNNVIPKEAVEWLNGYVPQLAGNLNDDVLEKVRDVLQVSLITGLTLQEQVKALREAAPELEAMTQHRIEAIARTEITRADTMGRLISMKANEDVIGVEFSAVLDDRTTEVCASRHGLVMRIDDPRLPENTPPLHVNCRSMLLPLTIYDYPDGILSSHEFDEIVVASQANPENTEIIEKILEIDVPSGGLFVKSISAANKMAVDLGLAKKADFRGLSVQAANDLIEGILRNKQLFPELGTFDFIGSSQKHSEYDYTVRVKRFNELWKKIKDKNIFRRQYPEMKKYTSDKELKEHVLSLYSPYDIKDNIYATSFSTIGAKGISLNDSFFSKTQHSITLKGLQKNESSAWAPQNCGTVKSLIDHEIGHQIDDLVKAREDAKIISLFNKYHNDKKTEKMKDVLSEYANENIREFIAEAWREYMNNPHVRAVAKAVGERIIELYKGKFSK